MNKKALRTAPPPYPPPRAGEGRGGGGAGDPGRIFSARAEPWVPALALHIGGWRRRGSLGRDDNPPILAPMSNRERGYGGSIYFFTNRLRFILLVYPA